MTKKNRDVHEWDASRLGELGEDSIRARHLPADSHRVSVSKYPPGTSFGGVTREGTCYVLKGKCRHSVPEELILGSGQFAMIPAGEYRFEVLGDTEVVLVNAWKLPFAVPSPKK